jgi:enamine deaminase RidA (YjgF/YER057c/UK114 family)
MIRRTIEGTWQKDRAFSPAVATQGGTVIWVAGHGATHDDAGRSLAGDFDAQVHQSFKDLARTLDQAGGTLADIVTMTVFIIDSRYGDRFVELRKTYFPTGFPASALITAAGFARPEMMVEIQPIAVVGDR